MALTVQATDTVADRRRRWWPLVVIAAAHLMVILDTTIMFVAMPSVQRALGMSVAERPWVLTGYTVAFGGLLLPAGRVADRLGARRTLLVGVLGFAAASALGGGAVTPWMLIAARTLQGAFGALLVSSTKALLANVYRGERERVRAMGVFSATLTAGAALGLIAGGTLTSLLSWRWCLYVNLPLCAFAVLGAVRVLPDLPGNRAARLDVVGAILGCAAIGTLVYGLAEAGPEGWASALVLGPLAAALVLLGVFVRRQATHAHPLLPLRVVTERNRAGANIALVFNSLSTVGMMLILTYQLQNVAHYSPVRTGLALLPFAVAAAVGAAVLAPRLLASLPTRYLVVAGTVLSAAGLAPLIWLTPNSHYVPLVFVATILEGLGTGLTAPAALTTGINGVDRADVGIASAMTSTSGQIGSSIGVALLNTVAASATAAYLGSHAHSSTVAATVHGFAVALAVATVLLLAAVVPLAILINSRITRR
jgi:EmrB/QacA subfamily drug resistance transporter